MYHTTTVSLLLRIGLASVFLYAGIAGLIEPSNWIGFIPQFLKNFFSESLLLTGFSSFEIILGIWVLTNWKIVYASLLAALTILGIILLNLGALDVTFRDVTVFFTALALFIANYTGKK